MTTWRYLAHDGVGAADGLALDEALATSYARGAEPKAPTLRLYYYRDHSALVGRYQHLEAELDTEACAELGVDCNRRPTGGGAIIMGSKQLGVAVATRAPAAKRPKELLEELSGGIVDALASLGIEAEFRGKNDLAVRGRKIAGLGVYLNGSGGLLFHASVLADLDVALMLKVLNIPAAKLGANGARAVSERVTTVSAELGEPWDARRLRQVVAKGFEQRLGVTLEAAEVDQKEAELATRLMQQRYLSDSWLHECSPRSDATATAVVRLKVGLVRIYLAAAEKTIKSVLFTGDFNSVPPALVAIEEGLRWKRLERPVISEVVEGCLSNSAEYLGDPQLITDALLEAAGRVTEQPSAAPERLGSCYFPEVSANT
jgi:lipoate-protein ligase A